MISGFAKLGAFPLHIWLPKVLGNAPDAISAVFSGGLEKLGAFVAVMGLLRFAPVGFNIDAISMQAGNLVVAGLGALTIVFGTLMAIRQDDAKKLLAFSSMSNGGYILVALALLDSAGVAGGLYHILAQFLLLLQDCPHVPSPFFTIEIGSLVQLKMKRSFLRPFFVTPPMRNFDFCMKKSLSC